MYCLILLFHLNILHFPLISKLSPIQDAETSKHVTNLMSTVSDKL